MKKAKRNAVLTIIIFLLAIAGGVFMAMFGVGKEKTGRTEDIPLGLDLQGGLSVTYEITTPNPSDEEINATIDKLQRRVDEYSSEGEVYQEGKDRITVEIPVDTSKYDAHDILDDLGQPGQLLFLDETNYNLWSQQKEYEVAVSGSDVKNANPATDDSGVTKDYVVQLQFTDEGAKKFETATAANIGKPIYIIYDGKVVSYPTVQQAISGGDAVINGMADYDEADKLASTIKIGALPLELSQLQYNIVGAKLGREAISTSLVAGGIGFGLVCLIMIVFYLLPGFIASLALVAYVLLMLLILSISSITLTLPGIAGIVLSIGMAVDANVIIFTRIKEEIADGKGVRAAADSGFHKALSAIIDGNITTLIAAIVLMLLGTGSIKGFATTLMLGIILSMVTALFITKWLLNAFVNLGLTNPKLFGKAKPPKKVNYCKISKFCAIISLVAIVAGLVFLPINKSKHGNILNFALEFTGGTSTTVTFDDTFDLSSLSQDEALKKVESEVVPVIADATSSTVTAANVQIQIVEDSNQVVFKTAELSEDDADKFEKAIKKKFGVTEISAQSISSTISGEMKKDAIIAIAIAAVLMLIYIAVRFSDVKFGASAVIALLHDVMCVFAIYSIARLSAGNTFIACMLTIVGYSINATIIIFDRIRENMKIMDKKTPLDELVDLSIAQTFTRTIYTSLTTFVMVLVLFIMGVPALKEFTFTLMAGIVIGAYSSVCITGPLWHFAKKHFSKKTSA